ncbi:hypothetical protein ONZ45_g6331 [Pleurotus djamor]|nr:hypothetical protein ONZ45_g6331 [Pleurotus djamor]
MESSRLPHELLHCVVDHIDLKDKPSLLNLLVSCRPLRAIAEPRFYRDVAFKIESSHRRHPRERIKGFYRQISKDNARLAPSVRRFTFILGPPNLWNDVSITEVLPLLVNLEYFRFSNLDLNIPFYSVLESLRSPQLNTVIWECFFTQQSHFLEEFLRLYPSIRHLEVPFKDNIDPLPPPFLPNLRELVASPDVAWSLLPGRHITHLRLHTPLFRPPGLPTNLPDLSSLTHFSMSLQTTILRYFDLINHMPNLQCLACLVVVPGIRITELPSLFATDDAHSKFRKLAYFSLCTSHCLDSPISMQTVLDLFESVPSLRVFDLKAEASSNFTRYRHDGQVAVMPLPLFGGTWPSEHELARILQTPNQTVLE